MNYCVDCKSHFWKVGERRCASETYRRKPGNHPVTGANGFFTRLGDFTTDEFPDCEEVRRRYRICSDFEAKEEQADG